MSTLLKTVAVAAAVAAVSFSGCVKEDARSSSATTLPTTIVSKPVVQPAFGFQQRMGDEIVVAGHFYRIGTPVVTWMDPGGYDAYRTTRHFAPYDVADFESTMREFDAKYTGRARRDYVTAPNRYSVRYANSTTQATSRAATQPDYISRSYALPATRPLTDAQFDEVRSGGWPLDLLRQKVDQFVLHYDVAGTSANCFKVLQDSRGLSVQFMLDLDGTIYQTLDLKERASHATKANDRSVGIEIANIGSYSTQNESPAPLLRWYKKDEQGRTFVAIPDSLGGLNGQRTRPSVLRPARNDVVVGTVQGVEQRMYDLTPQQYAALIKLTAALGDVFPLIKLDYPRGPDGQLLTRALDDGAYGKYQGVLGHYHVQTNKSDPGVAFQWDLLIDGARRELAARHTSMAKK